MTVATTTSAITYAGTGSTSVFPYTWQVNSAADLVVFTWVPATGVITQLALNTGYTLTGIGYPTGGTVVLTAGNLPSGTSIFIASDPALVQNLTLNQAAPFNASDLMNQLDYLTREVQAARRIANNSMQFPQVESVAGLIATMPAASQRASKYLAFDTNGNAIAATAITGGTPVSAAMIPVVTAATTQLARAALGPINEVYSVDNYSSFNAAVAAVPNGAILQLGPGPYVCNTNFTRGQITIRGVGMPAYNSLTGTTHLVGGTIIQGTMGFLGDQVTIEDLGIDCGSQVCTAINGGVGMDCLAFQDGTGTLHYQTTVRNVMCLGQSPTAAYHCFLFQGLVDSYFENLHCKYNEWGCVMKTTNSHLVGLVANSHSQAGWTFKSDSGVSGTVCLQSTASQIRVTNPECTTAAECGLIYAATSSLDDCYLSDFIFDGGIIGLSIVCDTRAVYVNLLNYVGISNGSIYGQTTGQGLSCFGAINEVLVNNVNIHNQASNLGIVVYSDCLGITLNNVRVDEPSANVTAINLAGRFTIQDVYCTVSGDTSVPNGINLVPEARTLMRLGQYFGTLYFSGTAAALTVANGWSSYFSTLAVRSQGNKTALFGRIAVPTGTWTSGEVVAATIPANLAPFTDKYFACYAYGSSSHVVNLHVTTAGNLQFDQLTTPAYFPTDILFVCLDGVMWLTPEEP